MASGSPPAPAPWSANAASGWNPNVFFQVGAAFSFSECASTIVASRSTGIRAPSAPGARSPASAQARPRAAARALRIARSARGASAASALISREITGSEATGPASSGWARSTATSARQSPPSPSATARPAMIFPGSCTARGARHRVKAPDRPWPRPVTRSASASSNPPACDTSPFPSADTVILERSPVFFTWKVPSVWRGQEPRQVPSSQAKGTFYI